MWISFRSGFNSLRPSVTNDVADTRLLYDPPFVSSPRNLVLEKNYKVTKTMKECDAGLRAGILSVTTTNQSKPEVQVVPESHPIREGEINLIYRFVSRNGRCSQVVDLLIKNKTSHQTSHHPCWGRIHNQSALCQLTFTTATNTQEFQLQNFMTNKNRKRKSKNEQLKFHPQQLPTYYFLKGFPCRPPTPQSQHTIGSLPHNRNSPTKTQLNGDQTKAQNRANNGH